MTALLDAPVGTLDVSRLEERQPDVPLTCTDRGWYSRGEREACHKKALYEAMCMGCGHIFRRRQEHYDEEAAEADKWGDGAPFDCAKCDTRFYLDQYVRIGT